MLLAPMRALFSAERTKRGKGVRLSKQAWIRVWGPLSAGAGERNGVRGRVFRAKLDAAASFDPETGSDLDVDGRKPILPGLHLKIERSIVDGACFAFALDGASGSRSTGRPMPTCDLIARMTGGANEKVGEARLNTPCERTHHSICPCPRPRALCGQSGRSAVAGPCALALLAGGLGSSSHAIDASLRCIPRRSYRHHPAALLTQPFP